MKLKNMPAEKVKTISKPKPIKMISKSADIVESTDTIFTFNSDPVIKKSKKMPKTKAIKEKLVPRVLPKVKVEEAKTPKLSVAQEIWASIKDRELGLFGLSGQTVEKYCFPLDFDPTKCFLKYKVSSVAPQLESIVPDLNFEIQGSIIVLTKKV